MEMSELIQGSYDTWDVGAAEDIWQKKQGAQLESGKITEEMAEASIGTEEKKIAPTKKNKNTMRLNLIKLEISFASISP